MKHVTHIFLADNQDITRRGVMALLEELLSEVVIEEVADYRTLQVLLRRFPSTLR